MALIEIKRRCDDCEKTRELLREAMREIESIRLDYLSLYDKVRTNLAKLAKRARDPDPSDGDGAPDPVAAARAALVQRKLGRRV